MKLVKSKNLHYIKNNEGKEVYYHSLFGNARLIDDNTKQILEFFEHSHTIDELICKLEIKKEEQDIVRDIIKDFIEAKFLLGEKENERDIIQKDNNDFIANAIKGFPLEFIGFSVTDRCNFACKYCIAGANKTKESYTDFDTKRLKFFIFKFAEELIYHQKKNLNIGFTGGEPLLYWKELKEVIEETYYKYRKSLEIKIFINTNISLITPEIAFFFQKYNISPSISLDGIEAWNNKVRVYKNGKETFKDIMKGIEKLRNYNVDCSSFYLTLTKENFNFNVIELINFAKDNGFKTITIEPDLVNVLGVEEEKICEKIFDIYNLGKLNQISVVGFWKRPFDNIVDYTDSSNGFCRALDFKSILVDREGYVSPCGYSSLKISKAERFKDIITDSRYIDFVKNNLRGNIDKCKGCKIEGFCKGGCLISREVSQDEEAIFKYRCSIYLKMTELLLKNAEYED